jgi:hypothetical protein
MKDAIASGQTKAIGYTNFLLAKTIVLYAVFASIPRSSEE